MRRPLDLPVAALALAVLVAAPSCGSSRSARSAEVKHVAGERSLALGPAAAANVPAHVLDVMNLWGYSGSSRALGEAAPYVTLAANPSPRNLAAIHAAGMRATVYTNFMLQYPCTGCSPMYGDVAAASSVQAKDCSGNALGVPRSGAIMTDPTVGALFDLYKKNFITSGRVAGYDYVFIDDIPGPPYGASSAPCNQSAFGAAIAKGVSALGIPAVIYNGFQSGQTLHPPDVASIVTATTIPAGATEEQCYSFSHAWGEGGDGVLGLVPWGNVENDEIAMAKRHLMFICLAKAAGDAAASSPIRLFVFASFMLTYDVGSSYIEEQHYANALDRNHPILPEFQLVALDPAVAEPNSIAALATGGVYVREYRGCYVKRVPIGGCAFVVNSESTDHANPLASGYRYSLVLSGGSVFDGGTASFSGAVPSAMPAHSAVILSKS